jgi:hypothetical protein
MIKLDRARVNLLLGTAAFSVSSAGSVLLHIVLAVSIYAKTGSGLMTSVFISLQWLPAMLVVLVRSDWNDGVDPRARWFRLELVSAALTVPIALIPDSAGYGPIVAILLVRGLVDQVNRINKTVAARVLFPRAKATHYASFLQSGYHVGIGFAAVAGVLVADRLEVRAVALLDAMTFVAAAGLVWFTRCIETSADAPRTAPQSLVARLAEYRNVLAGDRRLLVCASGAALFSSTHATLVAFVSVYFLICYLSLAAWAVLGDRVAVLLHSRLRIRVFNLTMGGMLIATAVYLMYAQVMRQMT